MPSPQVCHLGIAALAALVSAPAWAQDPPPNAITLSVPQTFDFHQTSPDTPAQRLRDAPVPDPSTLP